MNRKKMAAISLAVGLGIILVASTLAIELPVQTRLPIHWNFRGQSDNFTKPWIALLMPLLVVGPLSILFYFLPVLEPRQRHLLRSAGLYTALWGSTLLLGIALQLAIVSAALHWRVRAPIFILAGISALFVITGNQLGKSRSMNRIGIRTRWTLSNEEVWIQTHRLSGKLMVGGGLLILLGALLGQQVASLLWLFLAVVIVSILIPTGWSYIFWRRQRLTIGATKDSS